MGRIQKTCTRILGAVIMARGAYSVFFSVLVMLALAGVFDIREFGPELSRYFASANPAIVVAWCAYASAYMAAGLAVLLGRRVLALTLYSIGYAIDITLWLSVHSVSFNADAAPAWASLADLFFNVFDLAALMVLTYRVMVARPIASSIHRLGPGK